MPGTRSTAHMATCPAPAPLRASPQLAVRFKGAVGGMYRSMGSLCRSANDSSVVDRDGVLEFNCTFARPADVPANFTFRSLTNAAGERGAAALPSSGLPRSQLAPD